MDVKDYSQNGEQAVILEVFKTLGIEKGHLVDLGAGDGYTMSNSRALLEMGWTGDLYDGDPKGAKDVQQQWITLPWVMGHNGPQACNFLNIDLDGNDYHILKGLFDTWTEGGYALPELVVCEFNPIFEFNEKKVMPYNEKHVWAGDTYYGASLGAFMDLMKGYGYRLSHIHAGINAFFIPFDGRNAISGKYRQKWDHKRHDPSLPWITLP